MKVEMEIGESHSYGPNNKQTRINIEGEAKTVMKLVNEIESVANNLSCRELK